MKQLFLFSLLTLFFNSFIGQECALLLPEVNTMGLQDRVFVDLDDVEVQTLPVVFHVVHTGAGEENNISDAQILSQVEVLNEEFLDSKIQFCLAVRDPEGNPTNGITRYDASWNEEYVYEGVSNGSPFSSGWYHGDMMEASGCWNPDEYINYYVVSEINGNNGGNGIQGFAYLGPTGDCRDGVVCMYNVTGNEGAVKPGRELGFTGVHEIGHHLSLYHTFSNTLGCEESNCETQGDQVCDTPPTFANQAGCNSPTCEGALMENFMDYTPESCKESFTVGQAERMHQQLQTLRTGLVDNVSCVPVVNYDVTPKTAFYQDTWCTPYQDIWIDVLNQGVLPVDGVAVQLFCNGNEYVEYIYDMQPGTVSVLFEQVYVDGAQQFEVQTNSEQDEYLDNDYAWWPISTEAGDLMEILVEPDTWANETDWGIYDSTGELLIGDGDYSIGGGQSFYYETCVFEGCYDVVITDTNGDGFCSIDFSGDGICDIGGNGITATINGQVVFETGFGAEFSVWEDTFCNTLPACELDYDGNGTIGNGDILVMLSYMGCDFCPVDPNGDGIVNIQDLLYMLWNVGDCPVEQDLSIGTYKTFFETPHQFFPVGKPRIYDITGRKVDKPFDELPTGVYILKWKGYTKKVFVQ